MIFAARAKINAGVIITIWSVNPLFMAVCDKLIFGQKLRYFHSLGMFAIVVCTIVISLAGIGSKQTAVDSVEPTAPAWIPVLFGLVTPMTFCSNGILTKHITHPRIGFNASRLSFNVYFAVNLLIMIYAIIYWQNNPFNSYLFWMGLVGSIINTLGIVCIQNALSRGPAGPISALAATPSFFLVIIESIKNQTLPSTMEWIALVFGIYGAFVLVIPKPMARVFCFCCLSKLHPDD